MSRSSGDGQLTKIDDYTSRLFAPRERTLRGGAMAILRQVTNIAWAALNVHIGSIWSWTEGERNRVIANHQTLLDNERCPAHAYCAV